jgi:amino acid transporter
LIDVVIKLCLWELENDFELSFFLTVGLEIVFLVGMFILTSIILAKKGISLGASDLMEGDFPSKRYAKICSVIGFVFGSSTIIRMIYFGRSPNYLIIDILFGIGFYIVVGLIAFLFFFLVFYLLFKYAKYNMNKTLMDGND